MNNFLYEQYSFKSNSEVVDNNNEQNFLSRIKQFDNVYSLKDAKELAQKIIPSKNGRTSFYVGKFKCIIYKSKDFYRLSIDSPEEFVSYNFE